MSNDWAFKMLEQLGPTFYGEVTLKVRAGEIIRVMKTETHVAPELAKALNQLSVSPPGNPAENPFVKGR